MSGILAPDSRVSPLDRRPCCCRGGRRPWRGSARWLIALLVLGMAIDLVARYPRFPEESSPSRLTDFAWLAWAGAAMDVRFSIALDGLSLWLFALTALLMVVAVLVSWEAIEDRASLYYRLLLVLETGMLGVFVARDIILFYVFFEFTLIPLFFLIGIWGGPQRRYAAMKFFLFTFAGSVLTFLGLLTHRALDLLRRRRRPGHAHPDVLHSDALTEALRSHPMDPTPADLDLSGPVCRLCHQGAALAAAHLAAAGPRRGADGGQRVPGRRAAEGGHVWLRAVQSAHAARTPPPCSCPGCCGSPLAGVIYGALVALAQARHQTAGRLFQRQPLGLLHVGALRRSTG